MRVDPYNPMASVGAMEWSPLTAINIGGANPVMLVGPDPLRLALLVIGPGPAVSYWLTPFRGDATRGIGPIDSENYVLIHSASYPGLVGVEWWIHSSAASTALWTAGRVRD